MTPPTASKDHTSLPPERTVAISSNGKRLREITPREVFQLRQWAIDFRFVREVEYLEREGRVPSRRELEEAIGLGRSVLLAVRAGLRSVSIANLALLHEKYRGDRDYIMYGQRNKELGAPYIPGVGRIDRYEPYIFEYKSPARWAVGPRPETQPEYCPSDPNNEQWTPPAAAARSRKHAAKDKTEDE